MISKAVYEDCRRRNKNLGTARIDYQKALLLLLLLLRCHPIAVSY
jgi:hypothetical protein